MIQALMWDPLSARLRSATSGVEVTVQESMDTACWIELGRTRYEPIQALQRAVVAARARGDVPDLVLCTEHEPVITLGRGTDPANVLVRDIPVVQVERGGDATYHGPGQLVLYPCFQLVLERRDLHAWLRTLEDVCLDVLAAFGIVGRREPGKTGVWVEGFKLASIGVAVSRWVTYHGIGFNVTTDREAFERIRPCGLSADVMRSVVDFEPAVSVNQVRDAFRAAFGARLDRCFTTLEEEVLRSRIAGL